MLLVLLAALPAAAQFIWVANTGEDTVSKIAINSGTEAGRYRTWFGPGSPNHVPHLGISGGGPPAGPAPSRIAVDAAGNAYVLNRFFTQHRPVLLKISPSGGGNTSTGSTPLPLNDTNPTNNRIDAAEIQDARVLWAVEIGQPGAWNAIVNPGDEGAIGRALCFDLSGNLWVGMHLSERYYRIDANTGAQLGPPVKTPGHRPYGCVVDLNGTLYSASNSTNIATFSTTAPPANASVLNHNNYGANYGISILNRCGQSSKVSLSERTGRTYISYDPASGSFANPALPASDQFASFAVAVDQNGDIISGAIPGRVVKWNGTTGAKMWDTNALGSTVAAVDLHGLIVDDNNDVWAVHLRRTANSLQNGFVVKYDGATGALEKDVPVGNLPYTYANAAPPSCPCGRIDRSELTCESLNGGVGTYSFTFTFTNQSPFAAPATSLDLTSSTTGVTVTPSPSVPLNPPVPQNGQGTVSGTLTVSNPKPGDRVCLDMQLSGGANGWCCPEQKVCFTIPECRSCVQAAGTFKCDSKGNLYLALTIVNNGPTTANAVQVFSTTPGVTVTPSLTQVSLPPGVPVTVNVSVSGVSPGQTIDLTANVHGPTDPKTGAYDWCCSTPFRVTVPVKIPCAIPVDDDPPHT